MAEKLPRQLRERLTDPALAAMDASRAEGKARFGPAMDAVVMEMVPLLEARKQRDLTIPQAKRLMALRAQLDALADQQQVFVASDLARRLGRPKAGTQSLLQTDEEQQLLPGSERQLGFQEAPRVS